ncbi:MAG TPA: hypothetical protein VMW38_08150 [Terriglobia bacterium]|nr:hypothetical protein [Terriglobia bacterium]
MKRILTPAALLAWFLLSDCGKVGDPLPPLVQIPAPVADLTTTQLGREVILSWSIPKLNTDGSEATTLESIEVFRVIRTPDSTPFGPELFSQDATLLAKISKWSFETYFKNGKIVFTDPLTGQGDEVFHKELGYMVQAFNRKRQHAGDSNLSSLQLVLVPEPPSNLSPSYSEGFIELNWEPPVQRIDHSAVSGIVRFNVYRSDTATQPVFDLLTKTPISETTYRDSTAVLDKTYLYRVRSAIAQGEGFVESSDSTTLRALNTDVYPPKSPLEITGFSNGEYVSLVWVPNSEPDLAGYDIYRSPDGKTYEKLTDQLEGASSFIDRKVEIGKLYYYRVRAVDTHKNQSEFSEAISVRVE